MELRGSCVLALPIFSAADEAAAGGKWIYRAARGVENAEDTISISKKSMRHVLDRHTWSGKYTRSTSAFFDQFADEDAIRALVNQAPQALPMPLHNGNLAYIVNAGEDVGVDYFTGLPTPWYTVVTDPSGQTLRTVHPGFPKGGQQ